MPRLARIEKHVMTIRNFYFRSKNCQKDDYYKAVNEMTSISFNLKSNHDDAADSLAVMAGYLENRIKTVSVVKQAL